MVHPTFQGLSDRRVLDQIQMFIDLDEVVKRVSGLKVHELSLCHHLAANDNNDFTFLNRLAGKYAISVNR